MFSMLLSFVALHSTSTPSCLSHSFPPEVRSMTRLHTMIPRRFFHSDFLSCSFPVPG